MTALATEPFVVRDLRPAGFWIRAVASLIDWLFLAAVMGLVRALVAYWVELSDGSPAVASSVTTAFSLYFWAAYYVVLHGATGQTLGKMAVGARVVSLDGGEISYGIAFVRWVGYLLSTLTLLLGYLMAGIRADKRTLHDLVAGTRVVRIRP
ncbi:MAG: RDD family protein [Candidatus Rokubacteria bacterium]|nr:RDD family protein [Candidatus Rokubacteria bacterium]